MNTILGTSTGVAVTLESTLVNTGTFLAVSAAGPLSDLALNAYVFGGTIINAGGTLEVGGGELQGVTFAGPLNFNPAGNVYLRITQGLTLENAAGGPGGVVNLASGGDTLAILDSETFDGAVVDIAGAGDSITAGTLTLGPALTVDVTGAQATISASTLTSAGTIAVTGTAASLALDTATLANNGTITVGAGAALTIGASINGSPVGQTLALTGTGAIALASGSALTLGADQSTAQLLSVLGTATGVAVTVLGTLYNSGTTVDVAAGGPFSSLTLAADVIGGTIVNAGTVSVDSSTFQGVTFAGPLNLTAGNDQLAVKQGLTLENAAGGAGGTINALSYYDAITVNDTETLDGAVVNLTAYGDAINGSTLTFGSLLALNVTGNQDAVNVGTLTALGTVLVTGNASSLTVNGTTLANAGTMAVSGNAASLSLAVATVANAGVMTVAGIGSSLDLDTATLTNSGVIAAGAGTTLKIGVNTSGGPVAQTLALAETGTFALASGSTLMLGADDTTGQLLTVLGTSTGVLVSVLGTLNNSGTVLDVTAGGTLGNLALQADVIGGTIVDAGGTVTVGTGTLQGVTFAGPLVLAPGGGVQLAIAQGLTLESAAGGPGGTVDILSNYNTITVTDSETLDGAVVDIAGIGVAIDGTTLALGAGLTLAVTGAAQVQAATLANAGTILVAKGGAVDLLFSTFANSGTIAVAAGGTLELGVGGAAQVLALANTGAITMAAGSTLELGGIETTAQLLALVNSQPGVTLEVFGTLINTGTSITLGSGLLGQVILDADVIGGTIVAGPSLTIAGSTLTGVTVEGTLALGGSSGVLTVSNGLTLETAAGGVPGTLDLIGSNDTLVIADAETLDQATVLASGAGDGITATAGTLSLGPNFTLDTTGSAFLSAGAVADAGTIIVAGTSSGLHITTGTITGGGTITVGAGDLLGIDVSQSFQVLLPGAQREPGRHRGPGDRCRRHPGDRWRRDGSPAADPARGQHRRRGRGTQHPGGHRRGPRPDHHGVAGQSAARTRRRSDRRHRHRRRRQPDRRGRHPGWRDVRRAAQRGWRPVCLHPRRPHPDRDRRHRARHHHGCRPL